MAKEDVWSGYFSRYVSTAGDRRIDAVELLDEEWGEGREAAALVLPYLSADSTALEIGCGIGRVSRFVAPHCDRLHCADILEEALREARRTLAPFSNVSFHKISGYDLGAFGPGTVDCVYSFTTFFHFDFELVVRYFAEIARVLRAGGTGIVEFRQWRGARDVHQLLDKI